MNPVVQADMATIGAAPLDWERLRGKTVLVTGGAGFLPAYMVEAMLWLNSTRNLDCRVICLTRNLSKAQARFAHHRSRHDLEFYVGDVSEPVEIHKTCHFVVHAASQASPKFYGVDPVGTMSANIMGTWHLLNQARLWKSEGFLFFSSGEVYGQVSPEKIPTSECDYGYIDILNTRSCYAEAKRAAETLLVSFCQQYEIHGSIVRPFHTYGPGMALDDGRVFADLVRDVVYRRDLQLHSDGAAVRAFCYLSDAVIGFFTVLLGGETGQAYNVGNPSGAISIRALADLLVELYPHFGLRVVRVDKPVDGYVKSPISINVPNIDKLRLLGWRPQLTPSEGFQRTISSFLN